MTRAYSSGGYATHPLLDSYPEVFVENWSLQECKDFLYSVEGQARYSGYGNVDVLLWHVECGQEKVYAAKWVDTGELMGLCSLRENPKDNQMFDGVSCKSVFQVHYYAWPLTPDRFVPAVLQYFNNHGIWNFAVITFPAAGIADSDGMRWARDFGFNRTLATYGEYTLRET